MCIISSRKGITVKQTVRLGYQLLTFNIKLATLSLVGAVAFLMLFFLSGL